MSHKAADRIRNVALIGHRGSGKTSLHEAMLFEAGAVKRLGKTLYADMRRMEAMVADSDLAWTIVRPSGLFEAPAVSDYAVAIDFFPHRFTARIDLADCLLRQALTDTYVRSTVAVATPSAKPSILKLVWQEGIRKKA